MKVIKTDKAPLPLGPYSQGILYGNLIFVSGQLGIDPKTGKLKEEFREEALQALNNLKAVVEAAGGSRCSIVKVTVYTTDISRFKEFNEVYREFFSGCPVLPTRAVVEVKGLPAGASVEVECIAVRG
ncbi:Rid family detoxifying hydrolase [Thermovibrio ammonificans]|jgi:2-iminobutanoate/2-iminopropanoate deaminase|uniref:Endoribonuclease L-PSP n=1 Tax=Thermovibrio ammonificans (strain DSM 15698 / JCM 12110 / HB-1) TaxID=648996 RepID=E8T4E4_THEA1|nr:Rid family detoxifying hydrolase [Thermovibrio ammonificans]ADU96279.1 endoribonuclease L-PSP [Thermovibrio ammonificans HB-1]